MNLIAEGLSDGISARRGQVLQIRPKAANSQVRRVAHDAGGDTFIAEAHWSFTYGASLPKIFWSKRWPDRHLEYRRL